jgi:Cd2+/Zn2+-exporting ATPase
LARVILKAAHYAKVVVRSAENAFHEVGLGVRAVVEGSLVEVGGFSAGGSTASLPGSLRQCLEKSMSRGATPLIVYRDRVPVGILNVSDRIRPVAIETIRHWHPHTLA